MLFFLNVAVEFLYSFKKGLTFFYKVVENGDFANAINFVLFVNNSDAGISDVVEITIGMDSYSIVPDCALCIIYILTYAYTIGVIIGLGVMVIYTGFIIKVVVYRFFTKKNVFYKTFIYKHKLFYYARH